MYFHFPFLHFYHLKVKGIMTDAMDIDPPTPVPAPGNAMAAMMAASKKGKGKMELSQAEVDAKDKKDKEGLPWYVPFLLYSISVFPFPSSLRKIVRGRQVVNLVKAEMLMCRVEKYRPVHLDDVVSHQDITATSKLRSLSDSRNELMSSREIHRSG